MICWFSNSIHSLCPNSINSKSSSEGAAITQSIGHPFHNHSNGPFPFSVLRKREIIGSKKAGWHSSCNITRTAYYIKLDLISCPVHDDRFATKPSVKSLTYTGMAQLRRHGTKTWNQCNQKPLMATPDRQGLEGEKERDRTSCQHWWGKNKIIHSLGVTEPRSTVYGGGKWAAKMLVKGSPGRTSHAGFPQRQTGNTVPLTHVLYISTGGSLPSFLLLLLICLNWWQYNYVCLLCCHFTSSSRARVPLLPHSLSLALVDQLGIHPAGEW